MLRGRLRARFDVGISLVEALYCRLGMESSDAVLEEMRALLLCMQYCCITHGLVSSCVHATFYVVYLSGIK